MAAGSGPSTSQQTQATETVSIAPEPATTTLLQPAPDIASSGSPDPAPRANASATTSTTTAAPPKSAIERIFSPVVKAMTGGGSTKAPAVPRSTPGPSAPTQATSTTTRDREPPKDPNSDTSPPQLVSIEFAPQEVHDGEQATIIITAVDDLSGIRGISGTIGSPTGKALQGFSEQREGDTNRYIGRVLIPKNAEEGLWRVSFLNMSDNASNAVTLNYAAGTVPPSAVLRVISSGNDSTPPTLKRIWLDRPAMRGGQKNLVFVEAVDEKSGMNLVSAVFQSPEKRARLGAGCKHGEGDVWECELNVPNCIDCGEWQLEQVTLQDKASNLATFRQDNPLVQPVKINIQGDGCDNTAPLLQSVSLDNNNVVIGRDAPMVIVTIVASDDSCGVGGASGQFSGPGVGSGGFFPFSLGPDPSTWVGRIQLDPHAPRGVWRINSIQLNDRGHNLRVYYASDPLLQNAFFQVR